MTIGEAPYGRALECQEGCGIYVFHDAEFRPLYVGKVSSRSFLERLSAHMDAHGHKGGADKGWFNTFHQRYEEHYGAYGLEAKREYLATCGLLLLRMPHGDAAAIERVEKALIHLHDPPLNRKTQIKKGNKHWKLLEGLNQSMAEEVANINPDLLTVVYSGWKV